MMHIMIFNSCSAIRTNDFKGPASTSLRTNITRNATTRSLKVNIEFGGADLNTSSSVSSNLFTKWLIQF